MRVPCVGGMQMSSQTREMHGFCWLDGGNFLLGHVGQGMVAASARWPRSRVVYSMSIGTRTFQGLLDRDASRCRAATPGRAPASRTRRVFRELSGKRNRQEHPAMV